jgi:S-adenosylmethionine:tRNA ribosyltransferase-isomerase
MKTSDFDYHLPDELIARYPLAERGGSRLLRVDGDAGTIADRRFAELPDFFRAGDLLVFNDTRVIKARLRGLKDSGGKIEALVERVLNEREALVFIRASKAPKPGVVLTFAEAVRTLVLERVGDMFRLGFDPARTVLEWLEEYGEVPLPPYLSRGAETSDDARYQTVYARDPGAVAAPTAGLHFDAAMLERLRDAGVGIRLRHPARGGGHLPAGAGGRPAGTQDACRALRHSPGHPGGRGADPGKRRPGVRGGHHQPARPGVRRPRR